MLLYCVFRAKFSVMLEFLIYTFLTLWYSDHEDRIFNHVIFDISFVLRETTVTILFSTGESVLMESKIVRVVFIKNMRDNMINMIENLIFSVRIFKSYPSICVEQSFIIIISHTTSILYFTQHVTHCHP